MWQIVQGGECEISLNDGCVAGINTLVPYWVATQGGVQMLDASAYQGPVGVNVTTLLHLNFKAGPGKLVSMPIYTLRDGALYTITCFLADNPDGGPIFKTMRMEVVDIFGKHIGEKLEPFVVSNHSTVRTAILWQTVAFNVRGTGMPFIPTLTPFTQHSHCNCASSYF